MPDVDVLLSIFVDHGGGKEVNNLDPSELRKLRNKQRKARKKAAQEEERAKQVQLSQNVQSKAKGTPNSANHQDGEADAPKKNDDLNPDKLSGVENPLEEALKFLTPLFQMLPNNPEIYCFGFEIYYRKQKPLLMLRSIKRLWQKDPEHPKFVSMVVRFAEFRKEHESEWPESVRQVVQSECSAMYGEKEPKAFLHEILDRYKWSVPHRHECSKMMYFLDPSSQRESIALATEIERGVEKVKLLDCEAVLESLLEGEFGDDVTSEMEAYKIKCRSRFPIARAFRTPEELLEAPSEKVVNNGGGIPDEWETTDEKAPTAGGDGSGGGDDDDSSSNNVTVANTKNGDGLKQGDARNHQVGVVH
ncbi:unnamed protein product [Notodromas monacha]|uniref:Uncharacterized protein n=1 Tax=Notodromas monacha TaxID=399045 RepID=A0A7R9GDT4_9CRUS|nr:unnamed protein product [Notodromas monacha]CAG0918879.1 unnamed protein product [Notodromas monacha]